MPLNFRSGHLFKWHITKKNKFLIWAVFFVLLCALWFAVTDFLPQYLLNRSDSLINLKRYNSFFFIALLVSLLYPLTAFWRSDISDPEVDDKICQQNFIDCFFIRNFISVMVGLFMIMGVACLISEYTAYKWTEGVKQDLATVAELKSRRMDDWRTYYSSLAVLSDELPVGDSLQVGTLPGRSSAKASTTQPVEIPVYRQNNGDSGFHQVQLKFVGSRGVLRVEPVDRVDDESLPRSFLERVIQSKRVMMGPMSNLMDEDGKEYSGFCMAVPVLDPADPSRIRSISIYHVNPQRFLYPYLQELMVNKRGERTLFLQREPSGLRIVTHKNDRLVPPRPEMKTTPEGDLVEKILAGTTGFIKGISADGKSRIAYISSVSESDWAVAQQIEEKEVYRQLRRLAWLILFVTALIITVIAVMLFLWLRHRHLRYQAEHLKLALRQQALIQHYDFLSKYANDIILLMDESGIIIEGNDRAEVAYGYSRLDLIGHNIRQLLSPSKLADFENRWKQLRNEKSLIFETLNVHRDGTPFFVEVSARVIEAQDEKFIQCIIRDISEKKKNEEVIWQHANYDQVTGLANRRMFMEALNHELRKSSRANLPLALMFLDLDKFKDVNDTLGHGVGDLLLMHVGERLRLCIRESDTVARLGGDEFTVILSGLVDFSSVKRVAENILHRLAEPFVIEGHQIHVSSSIGVTFFPEDARDAETLIKNADQAMYAAKNNGGNRYHYFTQAMQESVQMRIGLTNDLRLALERKQFEVLYQPILNLKTGRVDHAEALIRWHHPERGLISPAEFIPLAEESGIILEFSDWVFLEAARQAKRWRQWVPDFKMSFNISPIQFRNEGVDLNSWIAYLASLELPPEAMIVEITEGLLLDVNDSIRQQLLDFNDHGIEVALDDFGTGYSSLSYLTRLEIDYIKIDRTFVENMVYNRNDRTLCEAITAMAHKLGMRVIAEGVENAEQLQALNLIGCDFAQGYHVAHVLTAAECDIFIQQHAR